MTQPADWHETARRLREPTNYASYGTDYTVEMHELEVGLPERAAQLIEDQAARITALEAELHQERATATDALFAQGSELVVAQMDTDALRNDLERANARVLELTTERANALAWLTAAHEEIRRLREDHDRTLRVAKAAFRGDHQPLLDAALAWIGEDRSDATLTAFENAARTYQAGLQ